MIGKKGMWVAQINGEEVKAEDLVTLAIYETAGLGLPTFTLRFRTQDEELYKKYSEPGFKINIGLGREDIEFNSDFTVFGKKGSNHGGYDSFLVNVSGVAGSLSYLTKQTSQAYAPKEGKKSSEVWSEVVGRSGLKPEVETSNDKMMWIQPNTTDRNFLQEVTSHGFFAANDPALCGIRRDNKAIYKPLSKLTTKKGVIGNMSNADVIANSFDTKGLSGAMSAIGGSSRTIPYRDMDGGTHESHSGSASALISNKSGLSSDYSKIQSVGSINENVHKKWWEAYCQNAQAKTSLSSEKIVAMCGDYYPTFVLDSYEIAFQKQMEFGQPLTPMNGLWLVTGVTCLIHNHIYTQHITLNRETLL